MILAPILFHLASGALLSSRRLEIDLKYWMSELPPHLSSRPLLELAIPGLDSNQNEILEIIILKRSF